MNKNTEKWKILRHIKDCKIKNNFLEFFGKYPYFTKVTYFQKGGFQNEIDI